MAEAKGSAVEQSQEEGSRLAAGVTMLRASGNRMVQVHVFPDEARLAADVARAAALVGDEATLDQDRWRAAVEERLRAWYPRLVVHSRIDFAAIVASEEVWYVMRDGRVRRPDGRIERLHAALATARDVTADADAALTRSRGIAAAAGAPRDRGRSAATATLDPTPRDETTRRRDRPSRDTESEDAALGDAAPEDAEMAHG